MLDIAPQHLELRQRMALAARIALLEALDPVRVTLAVSSETERIAALEEHIYSITNEVLREGVSPPLRLDEYTVSVVAEALRFLEYDLRRAPEVFDPVARRLESAYGAIQCAVCCGAERTPCDGTVADHATVAEGGLCIEPLRRMNQRVASAVARAYSVLSQVGGGPKVVLSTALESDGALADVMPALSGETRFHDEIEYRSEVVIYANVRRFANDAYSAVPYVLFHEYVVHVYQALLSGEMPRSAPEPSDSFLEGWMDFVAADICIRHVTTHIGVWPTAAATAAASIRARRNSLTSLDGRHRAIGDLAARRTLSWFHRLFDDEKQASDEFYRLSFRLNLGWRNGGFEHQAFVMNAAALFGSEAPASFEAAKALRDYLADVPLGDPRPMFDACERLAKAL